MDHESFKKIVYTRSINEFPSKGLTMFIPKKIKWVLVFTLSLIMSHAPQVALAEISKEYSGQMIPTFYVVTEMTRAQAESKVSDFINISEVRQQLMDSGLSSDEVSTRMAALSENELRQLATQVEEARAGGDILLTILVVILIIFLVKRI
jgi:hypothetical protein